MYGNPICRHILLIILQFSVFNFTGVYGQTIVINEFMADNSAVIKDSEGEYADWIEVFNPADTTVNLSGWSLTDTKDTPGKWKFPSVKIAPKGYLLVFASGKDKIIGGVELHTNFKLSKSGEFLGLYNPSGIAVSIFNPIFPEQNENLSYAYDGLQYLECYTPSPGSENKFISETVLYPPYIATKHGFYSNAFKAGITLPHSDAPIYYTTNGSEPDEKTGKLYTDSVTINTTTVLRARAVKSASLKSTVVTQTYLFIDDILKQTNHPEGYPDTWGPYTGIPGIAPADYEMDQEIVQDDRYKNDFKTAMLAIPTISIVTDIKYLFSKSTHPDSGGIYIYTGAPGPGEIPQLGEDWERPASVEFYNANGSHDFSINCGLRLHGGHSRRAEKSPKHSFTLTFREKYGASKLNYPLFGDTGVAQSFNSIILRAGFGNTWTHWSSPERDRHQLIQDLWAKDKHLEMGNPAGRGIYAHLYLNGIYWGIYNPTEKLDNDFAASYLGGDNDDYDVIKDYGEIVDGDMGAWNDLLSLARQGLSTDAAYFRLQGKNPDGTTNPAYLAYADVQNLADYMILNFFVSNADWDHHNWTAMRNRVYPGKGFKFFSWDAERIIESINANIVNENNKNCPSEIFQLLTNNNKFRYLFAQRVELFCKNGGVLTPEMCQKTWMVRSNQLDPAIIAESARWGDYRRDVHPYNTGPFELYTRDHWLIQKGIILNTYFPNRTNAFLSELQTANLYPYRELITDLPDIFGNPEKSWLGQNYPNPFTNSTTIAYQLGKSDVVSLSLYNVTGKIIRKLVYEYKDKGKYSIEVNAFGLPSGVYYYTLMAGNILIDTRSMIVTGE